MGTFGQRFPQGFAVGNGDVQFRIGNVIDFRLHGSIQSKHFGQGHGRFRKGLAIFECGGEVGIVVRSHCSIRIGAAGGTDNSEIHCPDRV